MATPSNTAGQDQNITLKPAVSLTDGHHQDSKQKVAEGNGASVSSLVAQAIEKLMQEEAERDAMQSGLSNTPRGQMNRPRSKFIAINEPIQSSMKSKSQ